MVMIAHIMNVRKPFHCTLQKGELGVFELYLNKNV